MGPTSPLGEPRPSLVSHTSETYEKAQEDEREVLKAVFMDDYEESEAKGAWSVSTETSPRGRFSGSAPRRPGDLRQRTL